MCDEHHHHGGDHLHDRDHDHDHAHGHGHDHRTPGPLERITHVQGGAPVLDIGGDIGALVVTVADERAGTELFLRPVDAPAATVHTGVWRRRHGDGVIAAAVFAELVAGSYDVLGDDGRPIERVEIHGGAIAELDHRLVSAGR